MSRSLIEDPQIHLPLMVRTNELGSYFRTKFSLPVRMSNENLSIDLIICNWNGEDSEDNDGEDSDDNGEDNDGEDDYYVNVHITFFNNGEHVIHIKGNLYFSTSNGDLVYEINQLNNFSVGPDNKEFTISSKMSFDYMRDYQFLSSSGKDYFIFTLVLSEVNLISLSNESVVSDLIGTDLNNMASNDNLMEYGPENRELKTFENYRKLKEWVTDSSEATGWRKASTYIKNEISKCRQTISIFPEKITSLKNEFLELQEKKKEISDQKKLVDHEMRDLQRSISEITQKNYILDRKLRTHQVISLSDQKYIAQLIGSDDGSKGDLESLTAAQTQLLLYNFSVLRRRILEEIAENHLCLICLEHRRSIVMEPCGHLSVCSSCAGDLSCQDTRACPKCTQPYRCAVRVAY